MDAQELRNLQEAYGKVYQEASQMRLPGETRGQFKRHQSRNQELLDAKERRQEDRARNKNPRFIGKGGKITKTQREEVDIYDIILSHLLDEGYAETPEAAEAIMVNMSEEWRENIIESMVSKERLQQLGWGTPPETPKRKPDITKPLPKDVLTPRTQP